MEDKNLKLLLKLIIQLVHLINKIIKQIENQIVVDLTRDQFLVIKIVIRFHDQDNLFNNLTDNLQLLIRLLHKEKNLNNKIKYKMIKVNNKSKAEYHLKK